MMTVEVGAFTPARLSEYQSVSIAFEVVSRHEARRVGDGESYVLEERTITSRYTKDYDVVSEAPIVWPHRFDTSRWQLLVARVDGECVGGAVLALDTPAIDLLEGRSDLALLWDMRVSPSFRGRGVGRALFEVAEAVAREHWCNELKVETQDTNVGACRFYAAMGCELRSVVEDAYMACPGEAQYLWYKALPDRARGHASLASR